MKRVRNIALGMLLGFGLLAAPVFYHYSKGNLTWTPLPPKSHTDAVVVFTGNADRTAKGYQFYLMGWAKRLMITGDDYQKEVKVPKVKQLSKRADKDDVTIDLEATNTIENAENSAQWILKNGAKTVLLITNEDHMDRAYFELRRMLPENVKIYANATPGKIDYPGLDSEKGRLICRMYETATGTSFCYQTRDIIKSLVGHLG